MVGSQLDLGSRARVLGLQDPGGSGGVGEELDSVPAVNVSGLQTGFVDGSGDGDGSC